MLRKKILSYLVLNKDKYTTGQALAKTFNISRQSVWKHIQSLVEAGYKIDAKHRNGYKLIITNQLSKNSVLDLATRSSLFQHGDYFEVIDSTNIFLKNHTADYVSALIVADCQTAGRGRLGRNWHSPKGEGLWFSMLLKPDIAPHHAAMLTQVVALAVHVAISNVADLKTQIKWPNDIFYQGKKLGGILTEMTTELDLIQSVVIGVGLNVNQKSFDSKINDIATSLQIISESKTSRYLILTEFINIFETLYNNFLKHRNLAFIITKLNEISCVVGRNINVIKNGDTHLAHAIAINEKGELKIIDKKGKETMLYYGEVSVRNI